AKSYVLPDTFERRFPSNFPHILLYGIEAAHFEPRLTRRLRTRHSRALLFLRGTLCIPAQLFIEFTVPFPLAPQRSQPARNNLHQPHHNSPVVDSRIRAIAALCACHSRVSLCSFFRPSTVNT